jgi:predicted phosphodiesterase
MKIHLISDVHAEMGVVETSMPEGTELVVMAGDIHSGVEGVSWAQDNFGKEIPIVYVPGNHEFYDEDLSVVEEMTEAAKGTNVHFLNDESVVIDGVRFIGSTLWASFNDWNDPANIEFFRRNMNDYNYIQAMWFFEDNPERIKLAEEIDQSFSLERFERNRFLLIPIILYIMHVEAMAYLEDALSEPFEGKTVVVTHHAPSCKSVSYHKEAYEDAYATALDYFVYKHQEVINAWFHGHLHQPVNYMIGGVAIVSNPRDYPCYGGHPDVEQFIFEV